MPPLVDSGADQTAPPPSDSGGHPVPDATAEASSGDASPADGASSTDGGNDAPAEASVTTGLSWPPGQIFPTFAPIGTLDVLRTSAAATDGGFSADVLTLVTTLQGLVNRTLPRIYIDDSANSSSPTTLWLHEMQVATNPVTDPLSLVTKYKAEIAGIVIDDDTVPDTLNLACTIAGIQGGIVASPTLAATLTAAPYNLPVLADLRTNHFASKLGVYQYELTNYAPQATHRLICGLTPSIADHLRDYAVATKAMMIWLDPTVAAEKAMLGQFLSLLAPDSPYMGWWTSEGDGVKAAATYGVPVYAADWSLNLTVHGGTPRGITAPAAPPPPPLENKLYVAMFMSDGDNLQEDEGLIPLKWADSNRGKAPISWTISPALVDVGPDMLRYFWRTATLDDLLVSGPSGLGYTYPTAWNATSFDTYTKVSADYMTQAGLRIATLWNNGADLSTVNAQSYATNMPNLLGLTIQNSSVAQQFLGGTLPLEVMELSYGDTEAIVESGVDSALNAFDRSRPAFAAVQGNMNMGTMNPTALMNVQNHYVNNTYVSFVRADHFFWLVSRAHSPPQHYVFPGDFNGDGKTDVAFYYSNGDFWFGLSDGQKLTWSRAVNVAGFGNLVDGGHAFYIADFNGDKKTDVLFYSTGDSNWWLGTSSGTALSFALVGNTPNIGNVLDGKHSVRVGDYDGNGKADVAVYSNADGSWNIGLSNGTALTWSSAGATGGFGDLLDGAHAFYDGDFDGDGKADVLFYYNGDQSLWLGHSTGTALTWSTLGDTKGFGNIIDLGHRVLAGDFNGDHKTDLLFYYAGDSNWWLGLSTGTGFTWSQAANTATLGDLHDYNHRLYAVDVDGDGKVDVVSYDAGSGNLEVGLSNGQALTWSAGGNASGYGDLVDPSRLLFFGDFDGSGKQAPLFYYSGDGNWWMSHATGTTFTWGSAGNSSGFGNLTQ
jgi:hypothetical protein